MSVSGCRPAPRPNVTASVQSSKLLSVLMHGEEVFNATENSCSFAGQLGRETPASASEGSSFFDHFVAWDGHMAPHTVISEEVSDVEYLVRRFSLRTTDTGSSLRVDVRVPSTEKNDDKEVRGFEITQQRLFVKIVRANIFQTLIIYAESF